MKTKTNVEMQSTQVKKQLLTVPQVAERLNFKLSKIYEMARAGRLPAFKIDGAVRCDPDDLEAWIAQQKIS